MSFQNRNSRVLNQEAIDSDFERLVRESPIPQRLFHDHSANSFAIPCARLGRPMSASAIPKMHAYTKASPCAQLAPFRSPQSLNVTFPSNASYPTAADIFKSLKNQSRTDGNYASFDTSQEIDYSSKENNSSVANYGSDREFLVLRNRQPRAHDDRSLGLGGSNLFVENARVTRQSMNQSHCLPIDSSLVQENGYNTSRFGNSVTESVEIRRHQDELRHQILQNQTENSAVGKGYYSYEETFQEAFCDSQTDEGTFSESLEACSLYMWIIKPVPGTCSICVEGKKSLADDTFWHSGVIVQRINEKVVVTQTKSVYRLEGNMELLDAMAAGFSRKTAEAFWLGFPADWQQLINNHFNTTQKISIQEEQADSEEEITTLEANGEDSDDQDTGHEDITLTELVSTDGGDDFEPAAVTDEDVHLEVIHSPVDNKKVGTKKGSKTEVVIENWIIKLLPNGKGINVLGTKPGSGLLWHSSAIEKRLDKKRLMSSSGSTYRLKGNLDRLLALNEGLPLQIINKFSSGFPKEWQELVQEFLCTKKSKKNKSDKSKLKKKKAQVGNRKDKDQKDTASHKKGTKKLQPGKQEEGSKVKEVLTSRQRVQRDQQECSDISMKDAERNRKKNTNTPVDTCKWTKNVLTPNGEMVDLESLGRSRSGRLIKPPLQWWTGQTLELDGDTITVKAPTAAASMFLQNFEEGFKKSKRKVKSYWNPREKDKDYSLNTTKSSVNISMSSVESVVKRNKGNKTSSENVDAVSESSDCDLDPKLKLEVKLILEKAKSKRTKVKQQETCYSRKKQNRENSTKSDNPFELDETTDLDNTTETEQGSSDQDKQRRPKRQGDNKTKKTLTKQGKHKVEQVNVVSSSTGDVVNLVDEGDRMAESIACRALRSRKAKTCDSDGANVLSRGNKKHDSFENSVIFSKRRKRILSVIKEDVVDDQDDEKEVQGGKNSELQTGSRRKSGGNRKGNSPFKNRYSGKKSVKIVNTVSKSPTVAEYVDHWTKEEKGRLKEACQKVSLSNPHYWERVAAEVRTKSGELCKAMYYSDQKVTKSAEKKSKKIVKEKAKVTCLTANVGTLKRKQQLRDLLEQRNENYSDDLFDSTPYRLTRKRKVPILGEDDDHAIFEELARKQGKGRFETPVGTDTMCSRITVPFASTKKTPMSIINAEMLEGSGDADGYVHKILKRRLLGKGKKKAGTPKPAQKVQEQVSPQQKLLFHEYLKEKKENAENHQDFDEEEDFYWEDDTEK